MSDRVLSESEIEHFIQRGWVKLSGCFSREQALEQTRRACERLYCSLDDPATWPEGRLRAPETGRVNFENIAPRAWQAACELIGGADRALSCTWGDGFIINFGREPFAWQPPSPTIYPEWQIWHKDGDFFRHFLDSPEQGLLVIAIYSDIAPAGGGTYLACDSVGHVARFLAEHPEGVLPMGTPADEIIGKCRDFIEATGEIGDVYLMHPFMLHTRSVNVSQRARFIINPPVKLREPMCFSRPRDEDHSPCERAVLRALGAARYEFVPTHPREAIVPKRLQVEKQIWEDRARQAGTAARSSSA
jgi:hypothetical protein